MRLRSRGLAPPASAIVGPGASPHLLEQLPTELLGLILRQASGTADVDARIDGANRAAYRLELSSIGKMIAGRRADVAHVCRRWRRILAPAFYHYAVYDGREGCLLVPEGHERHIRWLLIHIPDDAGGYHSAVRAMYCLPPEVRSRVLLVGICMNTRASISTSEYGPLAGAFPCLRQIWLDMGLLTSALRGVYSVVAGTNAPPPITALVLRDDVFRKRADAVSLVRAAAASLAQLSLQPTHLSTACEVLWGHDAQVAGSKPLFPQLVRLSMRICNTHSEQSVMPPPACQFPELKILVCHAVSWKMRRDAAAELHGPMRQFVATLLEQIPMQLQRLSIDDLDGDVTGMLSGKTLRLETLKLAHRCQPRNSNGSISLQRVLEMALANHELKALTSVEESFPDHLPFALSTQSHTHLRVLDIESWSLTLCDLQVLLAKLPRLVEARVALTQPQTHPAREDISYHMAMERLWVDSDMGSDSGWDPGSFESLATLLVRMPRLSKAVLFDEAEQWLAKAMTRRNRKDLQHLARCANIGCVHAQ